MQARSDRFDNHAKANVRPLSWSLKASFDKAIDDDVTYFTLDTSVLDGVDILRPEEDNPVQQWDKYEYIDLTNRAISLEVTREESEPYSIVQAYADVAVNNYDGYFTPNSGSPIDQFILPRRPFRVAMGFNGESLQQIVGLTTSVPTIEKSSRTASFHIEDFMGYLYDQDIGETIMLENVKTHEVLDYLFQYMGLLPGQYELDTSLNTIKFFYVEKGASFGSVVSKVMEAEIGRLYMDELGMIIFRNRYNYNDTTVYEFNERNIIDYKISTEDSIINSVEITSNIRTVQEEQSVWMSATTYIIAPGQISEAIFADFLDPVTSANEPVYSDVEINDSYFSAYLNEDGTGDYSDVVVNSFEVFSKSAKINFENTGSSTAYVTKISIYGTPAKIVNRIKVAEKNDESIEKYEERRYEIDNEYIQDRDSALSRAAILLRDYAEYGSILELQVKGNPALQLGDQVLVTIDGYDDTYIIIKEENTYSQGNFRQIIKVRQKDIPEFFTLDESELNGSDLLAP